MSGREIGLDPEVRFWMRATRGEPDDCWMWRGVKTHKGYGMIRWVTRREMAHRAAYMMAFGPIPQGFVIMHTCDNPSCVNPAHLRAGTQKENLADMDAKGRRRTGHAYGESHPLHKLTVGQVLEIKASSESDTTLARKYGVWPNSIRNIRAGKTWRAVTCPI